MKLKQYSRARENCTSALQIDSSNIKALFRRGQANYSLKEFEKSIADFQTVLEKDPSNVDAKKHLKMVKDAEQAQKEKEKKMYQSMFGGK